jgi:hypothetical protein
MLILPLECLDMLSMEPLSPPAEKDQEWMISLILVLESSWKHKNIIHFARNMDLNPLAILILTSLNKSLRITNKKIYFIKPQLKIFNLCPLALMAIVRAMDDNYDTYISCYNTGSYIYLFIIIYNYKYINITKKFNISFFFINCC